ncbi:MAG: type II toxin-antitoxin system PemK/MazF family toxin [Acetobacteraceae bacterium]
MTARSYRPDAGDLIWTDFDPTRGREQAGRRPALVISPAALTENTGLAIVCPITSKVRPFPTSVVLPPGLAVSGEILTSDIRSIDTGARPVRYIRHYRAARDRPARPGKTRIFDHDLTAAAGSLCSKRRAWRHSIRSIETYAAFP